MKYFSAPFDVVVMRFYLTMFIAVAAFMTGYPVFAILCLPTFLAALLGVQVTPKTQQINQAKLTMKRNNAERVAA